MSNLCSIDLYIHNDGTIHAIPYFMTTAGFGRSTDYYRELKPPYGAAQIGELVGRIREETADHPVIDVVQDPEGASAFRIIAGGKGFLAFQADRQLIRASFQEGIRLYYVYRQDRGFGLDRDDTVIERLLPGDCSPEEIGRAVDGIYAEFNGRHLIRID